MLIRVGENTVINNTVRGIGWYPLKSYNLVYGGIYLSQKQNYSLIFSDNVFSQLNLNHKV